MTEYLDNFYIREILTSLIFIGILMTVRVLLIRVTKRDGDVISKDQRRWIVRVKNTSIVVGIIGIIMIWAPQLHTLALSLTAVTIAIVVALKEVILCITAAFVRVTTTPFRVGDWIVLEGQAGEVIDIDAFTLRMQEVDLANSSYEYTGRIITVPNSKIFTANITNLNFTRKGHLFKDVTVNVAYNEVDPNALVDSFETIVKAVYEGHREKATDSIRRAVKKTGLGLSSPEPVITIRTTDLGHYVLAARLFIPVEKVAEISAAIVQQTAAKAYELRQLQKTPTPVNDEE
jgi:small-conductance mechanosensitive channel